MYPTVATKDELDMYWYDTDININLIEESYYQYHCKTSVVIYDHISDTVGVFFQVTNF